MNICWRARGEFAPDSGCAGELLRFQPFETGSGRKIQIGGGPASGRHCPRARNLGLLRHRKDMDMDEQPFWRRKPLARMTKAEWESLCDGCGRCCLNKIEEEDSGRIYYTDVGCTLLDGHTCRCKDYANRLDLVSDCLQLTPANITELKWLPPTCGYRLVAEGRDLYWWHPLVSGDPETVHAAGVSVRGRVGLSEDDLGDQDYEDRIVSWPQRVPAKAKRRP
jgi:uncharacterized cysteine cluster protein YcgN (CxxCxxCC family)